MCSPLPFERIYRRHGGEVLAFLQRRLGATDAHDAFQDTMLRALRLHEPLSDYSEPELGSSQSHAPR